MKTISTKIVVVLSSLAMTVAPLAMPIANVSADSTGNGSLSASVTTGTPTTIIINSITLVKNTGGAGGTFSDGWRWIVDITAPYNETNLTMKFDNWLRQGGGGTIPVGGNMRFYSAQSSNASTQNNAIYLTGAGVYSPTMALNGNSINSTTQRRVQLIVETQIPNGTPQGAYSTNFGIATN